MLRTLCVSEHQETHSLICAMVAAGSSDAGDDGQVGDAGLLEGGDPLLDVRRGADQVAGLEPLGRDQGLGVALLAVEVEVLDLLGLLLVAVVAGELVVEVLAAGAHAADVQRVHRAHEVEQRLGLRALADRDHAAGGDLERGRGRRSAWRRPWRARRPRPSWAFSGQEQERQPAVGDLGGHRDVLVAERRRPRAGRRCARAWVRIFSGLPRPRPWSAGSGSVKMPSWCRAARGAGPAG